MDPTSFSNRPVVHKPARPPFQIEAGVYSEPCSDSACALFAPMHYEPGYAYPLIVWLHGPGGAERQLLRVMPLVSMRNYVAAGPRATFREENQAETACIDRWQQTGQHISLAENRVFESIELARSKYHVNAGRIFLAGFDCGGTMALRIALAHPHRFRGVISLGGPLPTGGTPLSSLTEARRVPALLAAGQHSTTFCPELVCGNLRLLHTAGMSITLRQYPCGQELSPQMLADVDRWIIDQITNPRPDRTRSDAE